MAAAVRREAISQLRQWTRRVSVAQATHRQPTPNMNRDIYVSYYRCWTFCFGGGASKTYSWKNSLYIVWLPRTLLLALLHAFILYFCLSLSVSITHSMRTFPVSTWTHYFKFIAPIVYYAGIIFLLAFLIASRLPYKSFFSCGRPSVSVATSHCLSFPLTFFPSSIQK